MQVQIILLFPCACCIISMKKSALAFLICLVALFLRVLNSSRSVSSPDFKDFLRAVSLFFSSCPSSAVNHGRACFRLRLNIFVLENLPNRFKSVVCSSLHAFSQHTFPVTLSQLVVFSSDSNFTRSFLGINEIAVPLLFMSFRVLYLCLLSFLVIYVRL